jgi:hypothetical protein
LLRLDTWTLYGCGCFIYKAGRKPVSSKAKQKYQFTRILQSPRRQQGPLSSQVAGGQTAGSSAQSALSVNTNYNISGSRVC